MSSDDLASFLEMATSDADQETMTHAPEDCTDWRNSCSGHNTLRLAAMVRGVLEGHSPGRADPSWCTGCGFSYPCSAVRVITRELTGKGGDDA
jgi:hypothetical protein